MSEVGTSVQYGCGWAPAEHWLNFDASPTLRFERLPLIGRVYTRNATRLPENVIYGDIVKGLPLPPASVARLYASHVIEHLCYEDALRALANSYSILRPGGVFRVIVPDLKGRAEIYVAQSGRNSPTAAGDFMRSTLLGQERRPRGLSAIAVAMFGGADHRWMWDEASMFEALESAGFTGIRRCSYGDSGNPLFAEVENPDRFRDGELTELAIECRRPT